jgi:serine/threonine protein kinase
LLFEYNVLLALKGLKHVCNVYGFVKNEQNLIIMDLLGSNLAKIRKYLEVKYNLQIAILLLIEMLDAIEEVHNCGFIHRDVKASNFVLS